MDSDSLVKSVLEGLGLSVRKLPERNKHKEQRPDFLASLDGLSILVEAKVRNDDQEELQRMEQELSEKGTSSSHHEVGSDNTLSGIIRKANRQLDAEQEESHDFKVLIFLADCINPQVVTEQIADTLYGSTMVLISRPGSRGVQEKRCYFYGPSEFYRCQTLDAVIIGFQVGGVWTLSLCLNPFSAAQNELRTSTFTEIFSENIIDPIEEEARGTALLPASDAPRPATKMARKMQSMFSTLDGMLRHLEQKYGFAPNSLMRADYFKPLIVVRKPSRP